MPRSRKRRPSIDSDSSSEFSEDVRETKRRKTEDSGSPSNDLDDGKSGQTTESSDSASSDMPTPLEGISAGSAAEEGKSPVTVEDSPAVDSLTAELERLKKELATKDEIITKQERTISAVKGTLQCVICYEMVVLPYVMSCGHMACYVCLFKWWSTDLGNVAPARPVGPDGFLLEDPDEPEEPVVLQWQPNGSSGEESDESDDDFVLPIPRPRAVRVPRVTNGVDNHATGQDNAAPPPVDGTPAPDDEDEEDLPIPNVVKRDKICGTCRTVIKTAPIRVYPVNDIVALFERPGKRKVKKNPWNGVFLSQDPFEHVPQYLYPWFLKTFTGARRNEDSDDGNDNPEPPPPVVVVQDTEDNVLRCGLCLHELLNGQCTNEECGAIYGNESVYEGTLSSDDEAGLPGFGHAVYEEDDDDEDSYDSSFIDDAPQGYTIVYASGPGESSGSDVSSDEDHGVGGVGIPDAGVPAISNNGEDQPEPGPSRVTHGPSHVETSSALSRDEVHEDYLTMRRFDILSNHDGLVSDDDQPGPSTRRRAGRQGTRIVSDHESDGDDSVAAISPPMSRRRRGKRPAVSAHRVETDSSDSKSESEKVVEDVVGYEESGEDENDILYREQHLFENTLPRREHESYVY